MPPLPSSRRGLAVVAAAALLAACQGSEKPHGDSAPRSSAPAVVVEQAAPDALALLDGLKKDDKLGPGTVVSIVKGRGGVIRVTYAVGDKRAAVEIGKLDPKAATPPVATQKYGIYGVADDAPPPTHDEQNKALEAVAARVKKTEGAVPEPAGLGMVMREERL